jgi:hypothetical protein
MTKIYFATFGGREEETNIRRSKRLLQEGQFARAVQALTPRGISNSHQAFEEMQRKHPQADPPTKPSEDPPTVPHVSPQQVANAVRSFRPGTAPGPSSFRAEHLKEAIFSPDPSKSEKALYAVTSLVNLLAAGKLPPSITPIFCGANLYAAAKKDGGFRPIAVGEIFRRLVSKCLAFEFAPRAAEYLKPLQMGVGVRAGCEAIVHAFCSLLEDPTLQDHSKWVLQVDLENAFNQVDRSHLFAEVRQHFPELSAWVEASYGTHCHLNFGSGTIPSSAGLHQGDPLAPLLFAIALQPVLLQIRKEVPDVLANVWFLDDGTFVGTNSDFRRAINILRREGPPRGLHLAPQKSSIWRNNNNPVTSDPQPHGIPCAPTGGFELLGCPVRDTAFTTEALDQRIQKTEVALTKLPHLEDSQGEFCLLRSCLSLTKISYSLRTCDPILHAPSYARFDGLLREIAGIILGGRGLGNGSRPHSQCRSEAWASAVQLPMQQHHL